MLDVKSESSPSLSVIKIIKHFLEVTLDIATRIIVHEKI